MSITTALQRPVLVMAVGEAALRPAMHLADWLPTMPAVRIAALASAAPDDDRIAAITPEQVGDELARALRGQTSGDAQRIHWIVLAQIAGDDGADARQLLLETILPAARQLNDNSRPFALTLVLLDAAVERGGTSSAFLRILADEIHAASIADKSQVYVLQAFLASGFALEQEELNEAGALACQALVLSNLPGNVVQTDLAVASPNSIIVMGDAADKLGIFGRVAVSTIRSRDAEIADHSATRNLSEFGLVQTDPRAHVEAHWEPPIFAANRPQMSNDASARIGASLAGGPKASFSGAPSIWADPMSELRRVDGDADAWIAQLDGWQRRVRTDFSSVLRELREASASERRRVRTLIDQQASALWGDEELAQPIPYLHEWIDRQHLHLAEDSRPQQRHTEGLRLDTQANARNALEGPFQSMRVEMSRRPNIVLLAVFTALVLTGGVALLWSMTGTLAELANKADISWLGPNITDQVVLLRVLILGLFIGLTLAASASSIWNAHVRWTRAYQDILAATVGVSRRETNALSREMQLVDSHWHVKTISAAQRHLAQVNERLMQIGLQLRRAPRPRGQAGYASGRLVHYVPRAGHSPLTSEDITLLPSDEAFQMLRSPEAAERWVTGDVERWRRDSQALLKNRDLELRQTDRNTAGIELRNAYSGFATHWPDIAKEFMIPSYQAPDMQVTEHDLVFATGRLSTLAVSNDATMNVGTIIQYPSERDEILLCRFQMGLTSITTRL